MSPSAGGSAREQALEKLSHLAPGRALEEAARRLSGGRGGPLAALPVADELSPERGAADGALLEAVVERALEGRRGAIFTPPSEAGILAAFALAHAAHRRGGPAPESALPSLLAGGDDRALSRALDGLRVLDPACGAGALLVAAERAARGVGARLRLHGLEVAPLAARAARLRLGLLGAAAVARRGNALEVDWPEADLILMNPPFVRHEALSPEWKEQATSLTGLPRQADLSAHFALLALRRAPVVGLVVPRGLSTSRSAGLFRAEARSRGGLAFSLRSRAKGSFAASVHTALAVWVEGRADSAPAEASVPLELLTRRDLASLARGAGSERIRIRREPAPAARGASRLGDACLVRFGVKTGCNAFFHLRPLGRGRYRSAAAGEVELDPADVSPLLSGLKEALAPERAETRFVLFRPGPGSETGRSYVELGESLGVHRRPTCAGRNPWWALAPGRGPAPVLYPAKVGARAFAFVNREGYFEDKKWHALFPREFEPWLVALVLSSTPVRLAVERAARQLTGAQAIADIDCGVLASAPFPGPADLRRLRRELEALRPALATDPVTTDLAAMLARPAQRELDLLVGRSLSLLPAEVEAVRSDLLSRLAERLAHAAGVRASLEAKRRSAP